MKVGGYRMVSPSIYDLNEIVDRRVRFERWYGMGGFHELRQDGWLQMESDFGTEVVVLKIESFAGKESPHFPAKPF